MIGGFILAGTIRPSYAQAPKPDAALAIILIRDALSALNQANWTGNYTVLRDYASPNFAKANNAANLVDIFRPIRSEKLNLSPVLYLTPKITKAELNEQGKKLVLDGFFDSKPKQIHFSLIFEPIANRWLLFGLGVRAVDVVAALPNKTQPVKRAAEATLPPIVKAQPVGQPNTDASKHVPVPVLRPIE